MEKGGVTIKPIGRKLFHLRNRYTTFMLYIEFYFFSFS